MVYKWVVECGCEHSEVESTAAALNHHTTVGVLVNVDANINKHDFTVQR